MTVDASSLIRAERDGEMFYFCCEGCRKKFVGQEAAPKSGTASGMYVCPMCPQVRQDHPGDCPFCGMALEKGDYGQARNLLGIGKRTVAPEVFEQMLKNPVISRHESRPEIMPFFFSNIRP